MGTLTSTAAISHLPLSQRKVERERPLPGDQGQPGAPEETPAPVLALSNTPAEPEEPQISLFWERAVAAAPRAHMVSAEPAVPASPAQEEPEREAGALMAEPMVPWDLPV